MPLIAYILTKLDLLGHDIDQVTAHVHSTCPTTVFPTSLKIWGG